MLSTCTRHSLPVYFDPEETGGFCPKCASLEPLEQQIPTEQVAAEISFDPVSRPKHYNYEGIECLDAMIAVFGLEDVKSFCRINAFKYLWRHKTKGNLIEDLNKAIWYLRFSQGDDPRTYRTKSQP